MAGRPASGEGHIETGKEHYRAAVISLAVPYHKLSVLNLDNRGIPGDKLVLHAIVVGWLNADIRIIDFNIQAGKGLQIIDGIGKD